MFTIRNEADGRATVYLYGTIGPDWWDPEEQNLARDFSQRLAELSPTPLDIRIDSSGGDVYEGFGIASAIQRYEGETCAYIDGIAASAASYVAVMADRVVMNDYSCFMIHKAWTSAFGMNADDLRTLAARLDGIDMCIAELIAKRSGQQVDDVLAAMAAETWYWGDEALEAGLCDEVIETEQRMAASLNREMAGMYRHVPDTVHLVDEARFAPAIGQARQEVDGDVLDTSHAPGSMPGGSKGEDPVAKTRLAIFGNRVWKEN